MIPHVYQQLAERTECDQVAAAKRLSDPFAARVNHAAVGLAGDAGELLAAVERWIYYGRDLDRNNVIEEMGDCLWYLAQMCNALGVRMGSVMAANIAKLQERYPEKFDGFLADEDNRDRGAEMEAINRSMDTVRDMPINCPKVIIEDKAMASPKLRENTLLQAARGHMCPKCKTPVTDEVVKQLWHRKINSGGCPACGCEFELEIRADGSRMGLFVLHEVEGSDNASAGE